MSNPMQKSLQGTSEFVNFSTTMQKSMCGSSQKIPIQNASIVNKMERQKDLKLYNQINKNKSIKEVDEHQQSNQFLNIGKWNKARQSDIRKKLGKEQFSLKQSENINKQSPKKVVEQAAVSHPPTSKWQKKKSHDSVVSSKLSQKHIQTNETHKQASKSHVHEDNQELQQEQNDEEQNQEQSEQQEQQEQQQEQEEEQQQEEQEQQEEEQDQDQEQQEQGQEQIQQQEQQEEQIHNGHDHYDGRQSSQAYKTQSINSSALNHTAKPSKWGKKKAPLQTLTKYETKQSSKDQPKSGKQYHSRLNSAVNLQKQDQQDQIVQQIEPQKIEEWAKVQKILLRLKLMLS